MKNNLRVTTKVILGLAINIGCVALFTFAAMLIGFLTYDNVILLLKLASMYGLAQATITSIIMCLTSRS